MHSPWRSTRDYDNNNTTTQTASPPSFARSHLHNQREMHTHVHHRFPPPRVSFTLIFDAVLLIGYHHPPTCVRMTFLLRACSHPSPHRAPRRLCRPHLWSMMSVRRRRGSCAQSVRAYHIFGTRRHRFAVVGESRHPPHFRRRRRRDGRDSGPSFLFAYRASHSF